jgi:hypothetical protein
MDVFDLRDRPTTTIDGLTGRLVDHDRNGATLLVNLDSGTRIDQPGLEIFLLRGRLDVAGQQLGPQDYALLGSRAEVRADAQALVWVPGKEPFGEARVETAVGAGWRAPALGSAPGMLFRPLRTEEQVDEFEGRRVTGTPRGFRRLTVLAPGWCERRCEVHAGCREENIVLAGDLMVCGKGRGVLGPGSVLVNEVGLRHGPMATRGGAVILISCDSWMSVDWSEASEADLAAIDAYLAQGPGWLR